MNLIEELENEQMEKLAADKSIPPFAPGDTIKVNVKVIEGERERIQTFEGLCIGRKNAGLNSSFTVRKIASGEGVERVFPVYSPNVASVDVVRRGDVRRAKLYYLRGLTGKKARIAEKTDGFAAKLNAESREAAAQAKASRDAKAKGGKKAKAAAAAAAAETPADAPAEEGGAQE